ncbi:MAG: hypothetical protein FH756_05410 [Firmicutes bacterium]|nr:hypothetical protein [Bacillota bacterium]
MLDENELSAVLGKLVEYQKGTGEKNTLIMLALLNLLGIVSNLDRMEGKANQSNSPLGQLPFNPAMLLSLLGGGQSSGQGKGQGFDLSSLMGLLGNFLGGMPGGGMMPQQPHHQDAKQDKSATETPVGKKAGKMKVEKNVSQPQTPNPAKSKQTGGKDDKPKKSEVIKWDFGDKEQG